MSLFYAMEETKSFIYSNTGLNQIHHGEDNVSESGLGQGCGKKVWQMVTCTTWCL